jgi:hypothetical protein
MAEETIERGGIHAAQDAQERVKRIIGGLPAHPRVPPVDAARPVLGGALWCRRIARRSRRGFI